MPLRSLLANSTMKGRVILGASVIGVLVVMFFMFRLASAPSYSTMLTGLDPAETGKITAALDEKGVGYELKNNGTALAVDKAMVAQARIALAEQGLPSKGQPGFELFDKQKLGASDFQQKVTYQRALEGQIASTIGQVQGVSGAQVSLVLPEEQLFSDEESPATAAVLLSGGSNSLDNAAVRGIASLVSSSVKGLKPKNVSITDGTGQLLWPQGDGSTTGGGTSSKIAAEARYDTQMESNLTALLAQTVGTDKAKVQVHSDLNVDQSTQDKLTYAKRGVPLKQTEETEQLEGGGGGGGGTAGTAGNLPSYAASGSGGNSNYERSSTQTDFGVDKTVTRTQIAGGQVNKLSVALVVDKSVPAAQVAQLRAAVEGAAGIDTQRGDVVAVSQVAFAKPEAAPAASPAADIMGYAKYAGVGLGLLAFLFLAMRQLKKRERESLGEPTWLRSIEAPTTLADLEAGRTRQMAVVSGVPEPSNTRLSAENIAERDPERVAQQIRTWMQED
jgi:flagellar M-ring protein FliF